MREPYTRKQDLHRYSILGIDYNTKPLGGIIHFDNLRAVTLKELIDNNFIDLNERQNNSPTTQQIYDFISKNPDFAAHGYLVANSRDDRRITLEGVMSVPYSEKTLDELDEIAENWLAEINIEPDEFLIDDVWIWWD